MLSPYSKSIADSLSYTCRPSSVPKLVPNLRNKSCYILHYRNLKIYSQLGLEVIKILEDILPTRIGSNKNS